MWYNCMAMGKRSALLAALLPIFAGCLGSKPPAAVHWTIDWDHADPAAPEDSVATFDAVRVSSVAVRPPYDGTRLSVLRPDGSVAFDAYNAFAAAPSALLRGAACDVMAASGKFAGVVASSSAAYTPLCAEITVERLALDCRDGVRRDASVSLSVVLLKGREVFRTAKGDGFQPTESCDYSAAFSKAFATALRKALGSL